MTVEEGGLMRWWSGLRITPFTWTLLLAGLLLFLASWIRQRRRQHSVFAELGIPYVPPHLIYGNNHILRAPGALSTDVLGSWIQQYGKVFGFYVGWQPNLVITDLDLVQKVLVREFPTFSNRPTLVIDAQPVVDCLVGLRDQRWKDVRSVLAPTFSVIKMKYMAGIMNEKADELLSIVSKKAARGEVIDWHSTYQAMTLDIISQCALALKTHCQRDQDGEDFFLAVRQFLKNAVNTAILLALYFKMFAKFLSFVSNQLAYSGRMTQMIVTHLKEVIAKRRKQGTATRYNDVLQLMLDAAEFLPEPESSMHSDSTSQNDASESVSKSKSSLNLDPISHNEIAKESDSTTQSSLHIDSTNQTGVTDSIPKKKPSLHFDTTSQNGHSQAPNRRPREMKALTDEEIIANAWVFLLGGFETTANTITYTSYLLGTHPQVQERVYQELQEVLQDSDEDLSYEQVHQLKYLDQVFCETLRLFPPAVNFVSREASRDIKLGDVCIPKGMSIQIPLWHIHRDPQQWPQPEVFDPERFSPEARANNTRHPMAYIPFGAGPRNCPGIRFGQLEAKLAVARVIRRFRLEACNETPIPLPFEIPTVTLNPAGPVYMKAVPR